MISYEGKTWIDCIAQEQDILEIEALIVDLRAALKYARENLFHLPQGPELGSWINGSIEEIDAVPAAHRKMGKGP